MKLVYCTKCHDIIRLRRVTKICDCGKVAGKYIDDINAVYCGESAVPMGIDNHDLKFVLNFYNAPASGREYGPRITAFLIRKDCETMKKVKPEKLV